MKIQKPEINPTFFYGPIISYKFNGDISKDKGKYRIRFTLTFKSGDVYPTQKSGFQTETEARKGKEVLIAELVRGEYIPFDYTVKEFFDYWLYSYMLDEKKIRYNTFKSYHNALYKHLLPALEEKKKLRLVTIEDIENAIRGVPYPEVQRRCVGLIKQVFEFACQKHYVSFNPSVAAIEIVKKDVPQKEKRIVVPYTVGQISYLLYTCKQNFGDMYLPLLFSFTLGTRISETIALMYTDIDFTSETVYIRRQLGRDIDDEDEEDLMTQQIPLKTRHGLRSIPAPKWVLDEIIVKRAWYEKQKQFIPGFQDHGYICCHSDGRPFDRGDFYEDFHTLTNMCGLPRVVWHDIRHMYASVLKHNAVNMKAVAEFLGHGSPDFTEEVYVYQEETAYDCSILVEMWDIIRPENESKMGNDVLDLPFTNDDYVSLLC